MKELLKLPFLQKFVFGLIANAADRIKKGLKRKKKEEAKPDPEPEPKKRKKTKLLDVIDRKDI
jgi:hypothetical protein